jgi:recombination protein RecR
MIEHSPVFKQLLKQMQQVPYLASKNIYRVLGYFLAMDSSKAELFCQAILDAKEHIVRCAICCAWKEKERICELCDGSKRDLSIICVVETWQELIAIEKTGGYKGTYHVLGGAICPLDGVTAQDLAITPLLDRLPSQVKEIILATNQTPEGEATAAYIAHQIKQYDTIKISCLARGVPVGSTLEYMDRVTIYKALSDRKLF